MFPTERGDMGEQFVGYLDAAPAQTGVGFPLEHVAFVTVYLDRSAGPFKKTVDSRAWGSCAWFAAEPERLVVFSEVFGQLGKRL